MSTVGPARNTLSLEEAAVSNEWEIAAMVEVLDMAVIRTRTKRACGQVVSRQTGWCELRSFPQWES